MRLANVIAVFTAGLVLSASGARAADDWKVYRYDDLGFSVEAPQVLTRAASNTQTVAGAVPTTTLSIDHGDMALAIMVGDYRKMASDPSLDGAVAGVVKQGELVSNQQVNVDGSVGHDVIVKLNDKGAIIFDRLILRGRMIYQIMAVGTLDKGLPPEQERFTRSFHLTGG